MKKLNLLSAAAMAMVMASCASDAPDAPNPNVVDDGEYAYITMNFGANTTNGTRDDATEQGTQDERQISDVVLYLYNKGTNNDGSRIITLSASRVEDKSIADIDNGYVPNWTNKAAQNETGGTVKFKVSKTTLNTLTNYAGKDVNYFMVCNGGTDLQFTDATVQNVIRHKVLENKISATPAAGDFIMGGTGEITFNDYTAPAETDENPVGGKANPWNMFSGTNTIEVERVVSKVSATFPEASHASNKYTENQSIPMQLISYAFVNQNTRGFLFGQYVKGGAIDASTNISQTDYNDITTTEAGNYNFDRSYWLLPASDPYYSNLGGITQPNTNTVTTSHRINTITNNSIVTDGLAKVNYFYPNTTYKAKAKYADLTYIAFKFKIADDVTSSGEYPTELKTILDAGVRPIYSMNGVLIGGYENFKDFTNPPTGNKLNENDIHQMWKTIDDLGLSTPEAKEAKLKELFGDTGLLEFKPEGGVYYVYYYHPVMDNSAATADYWKYAMRHNTVYNITMGNLLQFGYPLDWDPDDEPVDNSDKFIQLKVSVKNWRSVTSTYDLQ